MQEKLKEYIKENLEKEKKTPFFQGLLGKLFQEREEESSFYDDSAIESAPSHGLYKQKSTISSYLEKEGLESSFQTMLFYYIDEKNLKDSDVYNRVHLDRRLFSKIRNDINYHPKKETVLLLGLALELDEEEIEVLLESASYSLPKNNYFDLIIRFCFKEHIYDIMKVNELLDSYHCKLLDY
ncbi:MAG: hypothetical protein IJ743_02710 [Bacilli bacterium]|nr:hypothetical protein [Bacilli bacterium]